MRKSPVKLNDKYWTIRVNKFLVKILFSIFICVVISSVTIRKVENKIKLSRYQGEINGTAMAQAHERRSLVRIAHMIKERKIPHTNHRWHERLTGEEQETWFCCDCGETITCPCKFDETNSDQYKQLE